MSTSKRYHSPRWRESPALSEAGLPMFFLVDVFVWYDVQSFLRKLLSSSLQSPVVQVPVTDLPREAILQLDEQMRFRYTAARRDAYFDPVRVRASCEPTTS